MLKPTNLYKSDWKKSRTFWKIFLRVDKMAWLLLDTMWESYIEYSDDVRPKWLFLIKPWDVRSTNDVVWKLLDWKWNEIWSWLILDKDTINDKFKPFQDWSDLWTTYATRPWSLWKPKTVWVFRIESKDGVNFALVRWDWWEAIEEVFIDWIKEPESLNLVIDVNWKVMSCLLFDKEIELYKKRIKKLLTPMHLLKKY